MVNPVSSFKGCFIVVAIDTAAAGIDQLADMVMAHALQEVEEAHNIGIDIGIGIFDAIAYAGLCGEIADGVELELLKELGELVSVFEVEFDELELVPVGVAGDYFAFSNFVNAELFKAVKLELYGVIAIDVV